MGCNRFKRNPKNPVNSKRSKYSQLKQQALSKWHNVIFFGLPEGTSSNNLTTERRKNGPPWYQHCHNIQAGSISDQPMDPIPGHWWFGMGKEILGLSKAPLSDYTKHYPNSRVLQRIAKTARLSPEMRFNDYKLTIDGTLLLITLIFFQMICNHLHLPVPRRRWFFFTKSSPFSNHFVRTPSQELVNSELTARAMETQDPADHKVILNKLYNNRRVAWIAQAPDLVIPAVRAKFEQNDDLAGFLIDTHPLPIGEASKNSVWGIGLSLDDKKALHPAHWSPNGPY